MYRNAHRCIKINATFDDDFLVQVGLHQGSVFNPLIFIIVPEALFRELRSRYPRELIYGNSLALESETLEILKERIEAWKGGLRVNVKKTKMMISSENSVKFTEEGKFLCAIWRKGVGSNLSQFCKCWVHMRCRDIRDKQKDESKFKSQSCPNQQIDIADHYPGIELNGQHLEIFVILVKNMS